MNTYLNERAFHPFHILANDEDFFQNILRSKSEWWFTQMFEK